MTTERRVPILVVGGGIGGLAAARALSLKGHRVHVLEQATEFAEIGAGLQLAPNALRALDRLQVLEAVSRDAVFPRQLLMMDAISGERITSVPLGDRFKSRYGYAYAVMHRSDLHMHLLQSCRQSSLVTLETSRRVVEVVDLGETVKVRCADGTIYLTDILIGADGLHSEVRRALGDTAAPVCEEYVAYRGTVSIDRITESAGTDSMVGWVGPEMHLIQYPVRRSELFNQVAVFRSTKYKPGCDDWGTVEELDAKFAPMHRFVRASLQTIGRERRWTMYDRPPLESWVRGSIVLVGDAAHPMLQYLAQGACQALEDAVCLAEMLERSKQREAGLHAYQSLRLAHTARVQLTARFFGEVAHAAGLSAMFRNAAFRQRDPEDYSYFDWLYGHDPLAPEHTSNRGVVEWLVRRTLGSADASQYPG
ncbi:FAD-dependent monooxygenase [Bradyrhizobium sp. 1]|uniref:FAD-dependent monooxygenase n=1 Tax=Bradyrhizobium sp. 1 TaxID=241591 RepID=UPI001FF78D81|nr:FAD-dependent monooxygenase [Bradyrhizobium sp. 1]MCK1394481.1 FAD-dependent monooxygenase [Bradyrhizobium sp. 1]